MNPVIINAIVGVMGVLAVGTFVLWHRRRLARASLRAYDRGVKNGAQLATLDAWLVLTRGGRLSGPAGTPFEGQHVDIRHDAGGGAPPGSTIAPVAAIDIFSLTKFDRSKLN